MVNAIDRTELIRLIEEENGQVVDVLPESEYQEAHLPGAVNIPLRRLAADTVQVLNRDLPVVVYCHDGL